VELAIYNVLGQKIRILVNGKMPAGNYRVQWDGRDDSGQVVASGIYLYRLVAEGQVQVRRMLVVR
jgi:flagellar hook assembly protein FlgD